MIWIGKHHVDEDNVDELDEIDGDEQLKLVWCDTHEQWEWHWLARGRG